MTKKKEKKKKKEKRKNKKKKTKNKIKLILKKKKKGSSKKMRCFILAFTSFSHMAFNIKISATNKNEATYYSVLFLMFLNTHINLFANCGFHS